VAADDRGTSPGLRPVWETLDLERKRLILHSFCDGPGVRRRPGFELESTLP
jgi:hypothetical protein